MSQNVQNYFLQLDTDELAAYLGTNPAPGPGKDSMILNFVTLAGPGICITRGGIQNYPIILEQDERVNISLVPKNLTSQNQVFFCSIDGQAPYTVGGEPGSDYFSGNYHDHGVTMHLTAEHTTDLTPLVFDLLLVTEEITTTYEFKIDPRLQIRQP